MPNNPAKECPTSVDFGFSFDNSYARELEGLYTSWKPADVPSPVLIQFNDQLATSLGLKSDALKSEQGAAFFAGNRLPPGATPIAQAYAGHQFGGFNPQLGDGRALLLGELVTPLGDRVDLQLKGSGPTPFSRGGDGKAALGPVLREYLMAESMHALGVPTTRALAAVSTGETVYRDKPLPGAVLTRVAASHIRVGTFQFIAARGELDKLKQLADYTLARHYPEASDTPAPYLSLLEAVIVSQAKLLARWMNLGFIHGVMNTDNMTLSGETIDYGPCAFMDRYDPDTVFSYIDRQGRYAYDNQPSMAQWNLARLAETLLPLIHKDENQAIQLATARVSDFADIYMTYWREGLAGKIGLQTGAPEMPELGTRLLSMMQEVSADYTRTFRSLADAAEGNQASLRGELANATKLEDWLTQWQLSLAERGDSPSEIAYSMRQVNPVYIPRNHLVEEALQAATERSDLSFFETLNKVLQAPFEQRDGLDRYASPAPANFGEYVTFCGT